MGVDDNRIFYLINIDFGIAISERLAQFICTKPGGRPYFDFYSRDNRRLNFWLLGLILICGRVFPILCS